MGPDYDRTNRVDGNYEKFRRYDAFLTWWWRHTPLGDRGEPPWVLFVCQNEAQRDKFLGAADGDLIGHLWHPSAGTTEEHYLGRRRILFACEADAHAGVLEARRVPGYPPRHACRRGRLAETRRVRLPGSVAAPPAASEPQATSPHDPAGPPDPQQNREAA